MAYVTAKIGPQLLNAVLGKIKVDAEQRFVDKKGLVRYDITVAFQVRNIGLRIENDTLKSSASVTVLAPKGAPIVVYTTQVEAGVDVRIADSKVVCRLTSLLVPVRFMTLVGEVNLGKVDLNPRLREPIEASFEVLPWTYTEVLPPELGGAPLRVRVEKPERTVGSGVIEASVSMRVLGPPRRRPGRMPAAPG